jgi:Zn-dependent protease
VTVAQCAGCGTELAPELLACPVCHRLVHSGRLKELAAQATAAADRGDLRQATQGWRSALELLPAGSSQHAQVLATVERLSRRLDEAPGPARPPGGPSRPTPHTRRGPVAAALVALGLLLVKFKFVLVLLVTKGKLLLLGLTKSSTLISMLLSFGVYWTAWGWKFAAGLVLSIYVHEMGHVVALAHFGIKASAPMFIPGLGAVVRLKQYPASPREDARVGLAGPVWGLGAAAATYLLHLATGNAALAAIAQVGAWINLFNLLPVWQLDGGRGFRAMGRHARLLCAGVILLMWVVSKEGLLLLILIMAGIRAFAGPFPGETDRRSVVEYVGLVVLLSLMTMIPVAV